MTVWFGGVMINRVMKTKAAVLALAAPLLLTAPALADHGRRADSGTSLSVSIGTPNADLTLSTGSHGNLVLARHGDRYSRRGYRGNEYGQSRREVRQLRREAKRACRRAIANEAYAIGFRDVDFDDDRRVRQIAPYGFVVRFDEVEFESRRREFERPVSCTVRRGQVRRIDGIPHRGHRGRGHHRRYRGHHAYH